MLDELRERYRALWPGRRGLDDVDDELRFHLEMREAEARGAGFTAADAHRAALDRFGDFHEIEADLKRVARARVHRAARTEWLADVGADIRFAWRSLRRAPAFAAAAVLTLGIAMGATTAIFSVVDA